MEGVALRTPEGDGKEIEIEIVIPVLGIQFD
jgi:hypothetical protein